MSSFELTLNPIRPTRNLANGRFLKGHVPANKGKTWAEYMSKRGQKRAAKGWENLKKYRPKKRADTAGRCRKPVIGILPDGTFKCFSCLSTASEYVGGLRENVGRCCRDNERVVTPKRGSMNTEHQYKGIRFYFESDPKWLDKIQKGEV